MPVTVHSVRGGLATNSSSSHSMILLPHPVDDTIDEGDGAYFGWDHFTAGSTARKQAYLGIVLRAALDYRMRMPDDLRDLVVRDWLGIDDLPDGSIDHQSHLGLPRAFGSPYLSRAFFDDLARFVLRPNLAILGGNDDGDEGHPLDTGDAFSLPIQGVDAEHLVARKDPVYGFWTLFNQETGGKIRLTFDHDPRVWPPRVLRTSRPELVDLKITDYCPFAGAGCQVPCYQGSTRDGHHAHTARTMELIDALAALEVFEIAIGGGEPTTHPSFLALLKRAREQGVVPNFTTRSLGWLRDPRQWVPILDAAGAFAFSAHRGGEIGDLAALLRSNGIEPSRAAIHLVMGTMNRWAFESLMDEAARHGLRVTLLGYKTAGRGAEATPEPYDWWIDVVQDLAQRQRLPQLAIDTPLAAAFVPQLTQAGVPHWMYGTVEGAFSAYIDTVAWKIGPSSYEDAAMIDLPPGGRHGPTQDELTTSIIASMRVWDRQELPMPDLED